MKDFTLKTHEKLLTFAKKDRLKVIFSKALYFMFSLVISRGHIFKIYYPFGIAFVSAVPYEMLVYTVVGTILGYLMPLGFGSGIKYIAASICVAVIRWAVCDINEIRKNIFYKPIAVVISIFITSTAVNFANGFNSYAFFSIFSECLIGVIITYFFDNTFKIMKEESINFLDLKKYLYILISTSLLIISLSEVGIHNISFGKILSIILVLSCSYCFGTMGGCISGVLVNVILSLSSFKLDYTCENYAFSGMISGVFLRFGKLGICGSFLSFYIILSLRCSNLPEVINGIYESVFAVIIFLLLSNSVFDFIKNSIFKSKYISTTNTSNLSVSSHLKSISDCFSICKNCVDKVEASIGNVSDVALEDACFNSVKSYCLNCKNHKICWGENCKYTYKYIRSLVENIPKSKNLNFEILENCSEQNYNEIVSRIENVKKDFRLYKDIKYQNKSFKENLKRYFESISCLISEISKDIGTTISLESKYKNILKSLLDKNFIKFQDIILKQINQSIFIEIRTDLFSKNKFTESLIDEISSCLNRKFCMPTFYNIENECIVKISQVRKYKVDFAVMQHSCNSSKFCGDSCKCFEDDFGNFNIIISDGMGSGSLASFEANLVSEFTKQFSKFLKDPKYILKLVNSTMLLNNNCEVLSAVDLLSVNLFTGKINLTKAGSPQSYILRKNILEKIDFSSLPIGILNDVSSSSVSIDLKPDDIIIMFSDGVTDIGENWIQNLIESMNLTNLNDITKYILKNAVRKRIFSKDDDITVVALKIIENLQNFKI